MSAYRGARQNPIVAADALLALWGVENPSEQQRVGALLLADVSERILENFPLRRRRK